MIVSRGSWKVLVVCTCVLAPMGATIGAFVAAIPERRNHAMVLAICAGNIDAVKQYLAEGGDPNTIFRYLDEPYYSAGYSPRALWVRFTGGPGRAPTMRDGWTPLTCAIWHRNPEIVRLLLDHGADPNKMDGWGESALTAVSDGTYDKTSIPVMLKNAGSDRSRVAHTTGQP